MSAVGASVKAVFGSFDRVHWCLAASAALSWGLLLADVGETVQNAIRHIRSVGLGASFGSPKRIKKASRDASLDKQPVAVRSNLPEAVAFLRGDREFAYSAKVGLFTDVDFYMHLTNGRYYRYADLGRLEMFTLTGIWEAAVNTKKFPVIASSSMRFRRELPLGKRFVIRLKCLGYDSSSLYLQHRFMMVEKDGSEDLAALLVVRVALTGKGNFNTHIFDYLGLHTLGGLEATRDPPKDVQDWAESVKVGSARANEGNAASPK